MIAGSRSFRNASRGLRSEAFQSNRKTRGTREIPKSHFKTQPVENGTVFLNVSCGRMHSELRAHLIFTGICRAKIFAMLTNNAEFRTAFLHSLPLSISRESENASDESAGTRLADLADVF